MSVRRRMPAPRASVRTGRHCRGRRRAHEIVTELGRVGLGRSNILPSRPPRQARTDVTYRCRSPVRWLSAVPARVSRRAHRKPNSMTPDGPTMIGYTRRRRNAYFPVHTREPETIQDSRKTRSDQGFSKGSQVQILSARPKKIAETLGFARFFVVEN